MNKEINVIELASELADERLRHEWIVDGRTGEIDIEDENGDMRYTEEAQDEFNRLYDMFYDLIMGTMDMKEMSKDNTEIPQFINDIDWGLLRDQKNTIVGLTSSNIVPLLNPHLDGIVHLIDSIQDYAVDVAGIDNEIVFGI